MTELIILFASAGLTGQQKPGARLHSDLNGLSLMISKISVGKNDKVLFTLIVLLSVKELSLLLYWLDIMWLF